MIRLPGDKEMAEASAELADVWNAAYWRAMNKGYDQCYAHHCGDLAVERYANKVKRLAARVPAPAHADTEREG